jgi:hypothetical protein
MEALKIKWLQVTAHSAARSVKTKKKKRKEKFLQENNFEQIPCLLYTLYFPFCD